MGRQSIRNFNKEYKWNRECTILENSAMIDPKDFTILRFNR